MEFGLKEKILGFLKENPDTEFSITEISRKLEISLNTVSKWVEILKIEGKIIVRELPNIKLVKMKVGEEDGSKTE